MTGNSILKTKGRMSKRHKKVSNFWLMIMMPELKSQIETCAWKGRRGKNLPAEGIC